MYPNILFLSSKSNEDSTNGDISDMGRRLATEVINYINEWCPNDKLGRLSFIGHSLGGIIIRSALPHLSNYSDKMYLYMSLSSPHLGYMYNSSKLIEAGKNNKQLLEILFKIIFLHRYLVFKDYEKK